MKVLVTGAGGFIAGSVIPKLLEQNIHVIAMSRARKSVEEKPWYEHVEFIEADVSDDVENWYEHLNRPDVMIHLAWDLLNEFSNSAHISQILPKHCAFLDNLLTNGLRELTVTGTCLEYGRVNGLLDENMITNPSLPYAIAKDTLRNYLLGPHSSYKSNIKWVRLFYMYGEGQSSNSLIPQLEQAISSGAREFNMSSGEQIRDFLHVSKVADYIIKVACNVRSIGIVNCCSGKPVSVRTLVENHVKKSGAKISLNLGYYKIPEYEALAFWGCDKKLNSCLGVE